MKGHDFFSFQEREGKGKRARRTEALMIAVHLVGKVDRVHHVPAAVDDAAPELGHDLAVSRRHGALAIGAEKKKNRKSTSKRCVSAARAERKRRNETHTYTHTTSG